MRRRCTQTHVHTLDKRHWNGTSMPTGSRSSQRQVRLDAADAYNRFGKWVLLMPLIVYCGTYVLSSHVTEGHNGQLVTTAKDGLRMTLNSHIPEWALALHSHCAMLLLVLTFLQKESVRKMAAAMTEAKPWSIVHRWLGRGCLLAVVGMDVGGVIMADYSDFPGFNVFIYFFAAPFAVFGIGLYFTAKPGWWHWHRLFANMLLKGSIGTPLARWGGSTLQHLGWGTSSGYYTGIGAVTVVLGSWQVYDLYIFARETSMIVNTSTTQTTSKFEFDKST